MNERLVKRKDRKLGHEWVEWTEETADRFPADTPASPWLWLVTMPVLINTVLVVILLLLTGIVSVLKISPIILVAIRGMIIVLTIFVAIYAILCIMSWLMKRDLAGFIAARRPLASLTFLIGHALHRIGLLSRDRLGNSFVRVFNAIQWESGRPMKETGQAVRFLILMPRCIAREAREEIMKKSQEHNIPYAIAGDGATARKAVEQHNPQAILAIACERDLVTGLRDVRTGIPIFCMTVSRPVGPCRDTLVDLEEFDRMIEEMSRSRN